MSMKIRVNEAQELDLHNASGYLVQTSFKDGFCREDLRRCIFASSLESPDVFSALQPGPFLTIYKLGLEELSKDKLDALVKAVKEFGGKGANAYKIVSPELTVEGELTFVTLPLAKITPLKEGQTVKQGNSPIYAYSKDTGWALAGTVHGKLKEYLISKGYDIVWA